MVSGKSPWQRTDTLRYFIARLPFGEYLVRVLTPRRQVLIASFPKCGRTWLRLMVGKALALDHGLMEDSEELVRLEPLSKRLATAPLITVKHDGRPHKKTADQLSTDKSRYREHKVILLVRDLRDVLVSLYFENRKRMRHVPESSLVDLRTFVHSKVGGLDTLIRYYNIWAENIHVPKGFLLVRYEDMQADAAGQLRAVLDFIGLRAVSDDVVQQAVAFASFHNMRQMELSGRFTGIELRLIDKGDPESFKARRGVVGGYADYMDNDLIAYVTDRMRRELSPFYGY